jgi:hypothetical protein
MILIDDHGVLHRIIFRMVVGWYMEVECGVGRGYGHIMTQLHPFAAGAYGSSPFVTGPQTDGTYEKCISATLLGIDRADAKATEIATAFSNVASDGPQPLQNNEHTHEMIFCCFAVSN